MRTNRVGKEWISNINFRLKTHCIQSLRASNKWRNVHSLHTVSVRRITYLGCYSIVNQKRNRENRKTLWNETWKIEIGQEKLQFPLLTPVFYFHFVVLLFRHYILPDEHLEVHIIFLFELYYNLFASQRDILKRLEASIFFGCWSFSEMHFKIKSKSYVKKIN